MELMKDKSLPVVVLGAGGHAKVVIATMEEAGIPVSFVLDDDPAKWGTEILGVKVMGGFSELTKRGVVRAVIAIGDNKTRKKVVERWSSCCMWLTVVHPQAYVHPTAKIGEGTVVFTGACIQPDTVVGKHAIINTGALIDHDCEIGDFVHIGPGSALAGGVHVGEGALVGIGSRVIPGRTIGMWAAVGAGSVVIQDIPAFTTAVGVPAREVKTRCISHRKRES